MAKHKRRKAAPPRARDTVNPTPERIAKGDLRMGETGGRTRIFGNDSTLIIDGLLRAELIDGPQHSAGEGYHELCVRAGRTGVKTGRYGPESYGESDRRDKARDACLRIDRMLETGPGREAMSCFITVCGENVRPYGEVALWLPRLILALNAVASA